jgi:PadR family transcriptional regulator PadR
VPVRHLLSLALVDDLFYSVVQMTRASLGDFELSVLLTVARLGEDAYGASVRRDVSARLARDFSVGAVYTTLQRLEAKGLLRSWMSDPEPVRGGRARRCVALTTAGERALTAAREANERLWKGAPRWRHA